jgi:2-dehydropantoate 2-reductase
MRYVIVGAGAIGGTIGGLLADSGQLVVLVARGEHARVTAEDGLRLATPDRVITVRPPVCADVAALELSAGDVVVLAIKSQHTAGVLEMLAGKPHADEVAVLCAQNGVENERIALRLFPFVLGCSVMVPSVHLEPGRVDAQGTPYSGMLEIGPYPVGAALPDGVTIDAVARDLTAARLITTVREDVMRWKYAKLVRNMGNAITALCGDDLDDEGRRLTGEAGRRARDEAERVLTLAGIDYVGSEEWNQHRGDRVQFGSVEGRSRGGGSSWQSMARGTGNIETDALNGEIVLLARLRATTAPVNEVLQREATALARRGGRPGEMSPQQLAALLDF